MNELDSFILKLSERCNKYSKVNIKIPCLFYTRYAGDSAKLIRVYKCCPQNRGKMKG